MLAVKTDYYKPEPRTGSRMVNCMQQNALYVFGGTNRAAQTLSDLWKFDLSSGKWQKLKPEGEIPQPRSGHSMTIHNDSIILFGGLFEVTREVNDTFRYDFISNTWTNLGLNP